MLLQKFNISIAEFTTVHLILVFAWETTLLLLYLLSIDGLKTWIFYQRYTPLTLHMLSNVHHN